MKLIINIKNQEVHTLAQKKEVNVCIFGLTKENYLIY